MKNTKSKFSTLLKKFKKFFLNLSNFKIILLVYTFITLFFALLLYTPAAQQEPYKNKIDFTDALFTSASAFSDTGLTVLPTAHAWSSFGQALIAVLILLGGIGIFAIKVYIFNVVFHKRMSLLSRNILEKERGARNSGDIKKTIAVSISILLFAIIISSLILFFMFYFENGNFVGDDIRLNPKGNWALSFKYAIFHSISALNNAGFDIISSNSLEPYYGVYSIQIVFIILLIIGGIGYPVIYDIHQYISYKIRRRTDFQFSLFTKISCATYFLVFLIGLGVTLIFELNSVDGIWNLENNILGSKNDRMMAIFFHVFSTRNAGFYTTSLQSFTETTLITFSIMMFIGSAPSSTAGGIRTTTLAIIVLAIWNKMRGVDGVRVFNRKINKETITSSFLVLIISILIVAITTMVCLTSLNTMWGNAPTFTKPGHDGKIISFVDVFFEVSSAFGTTGLSSGLTPFLNIGSRFFLIITMFVGQLGISSTILMWKSKNNNKNDIDFIEESIAIG